MIASPPLIGAELIKCANANAKRGAEFAAQQCGYGDQQEQFLEAVQDACQSIYNSNVVLNSPQES